MVEGDFGSDLLVGMRLIHHYRGREICVLQGYKVRTLAGIWRKVVRSRSLCISRLRHASLADNATDFASLTALADEAGCCVTSFAGVCSAVSTGAPVEENRLKMRVCRLRANWRPAED